MNNSMRVHPSAAVKLCSSLIAVLMFCSGAGICEMQGPAGPPPAQPRVDKKDVTDPVLQEIIANFSNRMPKFLNQYGANVFVADGPVTRGSLLVAFYEFNKTLSLPKSGETGGVSRREAEDMRARLAALEKGGAGGGARQPLSAGLNPQEVAQLLNDLEPNMPILLDNTLDNSKIFSELKTSFEQRLSALEHGRGYAAAGPALTNDRSQANLDKTNLDKMYVSRKEFNDLRNSLPYGDLEKRLDALENGRQGGTVADADQGSYVSRKEFDEFRGKLALAPGDKKGVATSAGAVRDMQNDVKKARSDVQELTEKVDRLERQQQGGSETREYASIFKKITLGLVVVAALFVAR